MSDMILTGRKLPRKRQSEHSCVYKKEIFMFLLELGIITDELIISEGKN